MRGCWGSVSPSPSTNDVEHILPMGICIRNAHTHTHMRVATQTNAENNAFINTRINLNSPLRNISMDVSILLFFSSWSGLKATVGIYTWNMGFPSSWSWTPTLPSIQASAPQCLPVAGTQTCKSPGFTALQPSCWHPDLSYSPAHLAWSSLPRELRFMSSPMLKSVTNRI